MTCHTRAAAATAALREYPRCSYRSNAGPKGREVCDGPRPTSSLRLPPPQGHSDWLTGSRQRLAAAVLLSLLPAGGRQGGRARRSASTMGHRS